MCASVCVKYYILSLCEDLVSYHISRCSNCRPLREIAGAIFQVESLVFVFYLVAPLLRVPQRTHEQHKAMRLAVAMIEEALI